MQKDSNELLMENIAVVVNPDVSIIIPVYNVEDYLEKCIKSIIAQSKASFELILIDDGSTDRSGFLCDLYEKKDDRIKVFHTDNFGVSSARNKGICEAKAQWIMFVDADDYIEQNTLALLFDKAIESNSDIICAAFFNDYKNEISICENSIGEEGTFNLKSVRGRFISKCRVSESEYLPNDYNNGPFLLSTCSKLYRKSFIEKNNITFPLNIKYGEDNAFNIKAICYANSLSFINIPLYHYVFRNNSTTKVDAEKWINYILDSSKFFDTLSIELNIEREFFLPNSIALYNDFDHIVSILALSEKRISKREKEKISMLLNDESFKKYFFSKILISKFDNKKRLYILLCKCNLYIIPILYKKLKYSVRNLLM